MIRHVEDLARRHRIRVTWVRSHPTMGEAFTDLREVVALQIRRPSDYLLALHELGHIVSKEARRTVDRVDAYGSILCEGAAWAWAIAAADPVLGRRIPAKEWDRAVRAYRSHMFWHVRTARESDPSCTPAYISVELEVP